MAELFVFLFPPAPLVMQPSWSSPLLLITVGLSVILSIGRHWALFEGGFFSVLNLTLVEQISSAEGSSLIPGWVNQSRSCMMGLRPPNERFVVHTSFVSDDPLTLTQQTYLILRSDRPDNLRPLT